MPREAAPLLDYFEKTYVRGNLRRNRRSPPMFEPRIWSIYENWQIGLPRTTNNVGAWHRRWENLVGRPYVGIFSFIREIQKEQATAEVQIENTIRNIALPKLTKTQEKREAGLITLMENRHLNLTSRIEFLRGIAHRLEL